mgnify:CR=1 FL=1
MNCERTYAKGVFSPFNKPEMNYCFVNTDLKNARIYYEVALFLNEELKNITFNKFKS